MQLQQLSGLEAVSKLSLLQLDPTASYTTCTLNCSHQHALPAVSPTRTEHDVQVPQLDINQGQRIGVVVKASATEGHYWVKAETRFAAPPAQVSGAAVLRVGSPAEDPQTLGFPDFTIPATPFNPMSLRAEKPLPEDMMVATKFITMAGIQTIGEGGQVLCVLTTLLLVLMVWRYGVTLNSGLYQWCCCDRGTSHIPYAD
jgi:hypothetical protein